jgi:exonuclease III
VVALVSWNVNRGQVWDALTFDGAFDIALLQEAPRPPVGAVPFCVPAPTADWSTTHWNSELRTCVALLSDRVRLEPRALRDTHDDDFAALGVSRRGTLTVADVRRGDEFLFTVASAYAAWESPPGRNDIIYADGSAHRLLSDISGLVTGRKNEKVVLAGDLNILFGYGEHGDAYFASRYQSVFDRAAAMGLQLVGPGAPNGRQAAPWPAELPDDSLNVPTFHHSKQTPKTATRQLDYVFATANIADKVQARALNGIEEWGPSDHCRTAISVDV